MPRDRAAALSVAPGPAGVKAGRAPEEIGLTFGLPKLGVRQVLALGNLLPRLRRMYCDGDLDRVSMRHLTMASKRQQRGWLETYDMPDVWTSKGAQLKAWLFGGQTISTLVALFSTCAVGLMQLMPATWAAMRARLVLGDDPYDLHDNIRAGVA